MFDARVLDSRPETAGIQPFRQTLDISPSLNSEASPPLILSGDNFLPPSEFEAGFQPIGARIGCIPWAGKHQVRVRLGCGRDMPAGGGRNEGKQW
jgi:hypothetical protein